MKLLLWYVLVTLCNCRIFIVKNNTPSAKDRLELSLGEPFKRDEASTSAICQNLCSSTPECKIAVFLQYNCFMFRNHTCEKSCPVTFVTPFPAGSRFGFSYINMDKSQSDVFDICENKCGARPLTITLLAKQFLMQNLIQGYLPNCELVWTGGFTPVAGSTDWRWYKSSTNSIEMSFTHWAPYDPNNYSGDQTAMLLTKEHNYKWVDMAPVYRASVGKQHCFICELD